MSCLKVTSISRLLVRKIGVRNVSSSSASETAKKGVKDFTEPLSTIDYGIMTGIGVVILWLGLHSHAPKYGPKVANGLWAEFLFKMFGKSRFGYRKKIHEQSQESKKADYRSFKDFPWRIYLD